MKMKEKKAKFNPIVITLETPDELRMFIGCLELANDDSGDNFNTLMLWRQMHKSKLALSSKTGAESFVNTLKTFLQKALSNYVFGGG